MLDLKGLLDFELIKYEEQIYSIKMEIEELPKGSLCQKSVNGIEYWYHYLFSDGKQHQHKLKDEELSLIKMICRRKFLESLVCNLSENLLIMQMLIKKVRIVDARKINRGLPLLYRRESNLSDLPDLAASSSNFREEGKGHVTAKGLRVRSKSEALLVEMFERHKVPFIYEPRLTLGGNIFVPDFLVRSTITGKEYLWEHFGMINDEDYLVRMDKKLKVYQENGYLICRNFLISYDEPDGNIDLEAIEKIITAYLI